MSKRGMTRVVELHRGDEVEVEVEKLVAGGDGLARCDGLPVFVPFSAPGDRARVRITERKPSYARAELVELLTPGPGRREPRCRHFEVCGGCDLQHLEDERQLELKVAATTETLARLSKVALPEAEVVSGDSWGYRRRAQLHGSPRGEAPALGFRQRGSHRLVRVLECPVLAPELEAVVRRLPDPLDETPPGRLHLAVGDDGRVAATPTNPWLAGGSLGFEVPPFSYEFDAGSFAQAHTGLTPALVKEVVGEATGQLALDLYAGVGLFALPLSARYERVIAVEGQREAARFARRNSSSNGVSNVEVVHQAVESWLDRFSQECDRVVVDPPRSGLDRAVVRRLLEIAPSAITYVSCHPAALSRDLGQLDGAYAVDRLVFFDLFPQTGHMEAVVHLARRLAA